jgi:acyl-CoA reductase-like NAD-dependent aldehyde dehydrogenase
MPSLRAMRVENAIRLGMFTVNDFGVSYLIQSLPFGGLKESGFGRFAGPEGLLCRKKHRHRSNS